MLSRLEVFAQDGHRSAPVTAFDITQSPATLLAILRGSSAILPTSINIRPAPKGHYIWYFQLLYALAF